MSATGTGAERPQIVIATRGSKLALIQAYHVRDCILAAHDDLTEDDIGFNIIKTSGDIIQDRPLMDVGGKGLFTKEIQQAMMDGSADLAVHSMKDMETWQPDGLVIGAVLEREDPRDVVITTDGRSLDELPEGAVFGTSSLRRRAQILHKRPDLKMVDMRGNVQTRLKKLANGVCEATLLAQAGINRLKLGKDDINAVPLTVDEMLPAVAQGTLAIECRDGDARILKLLAPLHDQDATATSTAERALLATLDGSCRTPIAAYAHIDDEGHMFLKGQLFSPDGTRMVEAVIDGPAADAAWLGREAGKVLARDGAAILEEIKATLS